MTKHGSEEYRIEVNEGLWKNSFTVHGPDTEIATFDSVEGAEHLIDQLELAYSKGIAEGIERARPKSGENDEALSVI